MITPLPPIEQPVIITTQLTIRTAPELLGREVANTAMTYGRGRRTYGRPFYPRRRYYGGRRWY